MIYIFLTKLNLSNEELLYKSLKILNFYKDNILLEYDKNGKPFLSNSSLYVSFSDSNEYKVIGISDENIGIDIEKIKTRNYKRIVDRMFSIEKNSITDLNSFISYWTKKEAISKFIGLGLKANFNEMNLNEYSINTILVEDYYLSIVSKQYSMFSINYI